ncbi:type VI secretion system baseplate subunit TssG [Granulicella tundricola]|uniref:Type VI secretion protein, VC_A0111 family n=1 Tax=Granulicella tundricola (strain ATCC BAA-1859 / DSM 23138 / MP5ACTX9) TaxID=1198114 RepID=E8X5R0_GRATM|nr:type VI secretion system baseplate subunit TssG [Granulicella tundricola]ADW70794.1 type VI secretion protein, VC_A0111 family [Granulicella tundricola MP5ACTX9]
MATESGHEGSALETDRAQFEAVRKMLDDEPFRVRFFQAVRMLQRMEKGRGTVGGFSQPQDETLRFSSLPTFGFPPSEIYDLERMSSGQLKMTVQFMGLTSALSALPSMYTEQALTRIREKDRAMVEFFDIFNHRILSLFYRAWEKHRYYIGYEAGLDDKLSLRLLDILGLGTEGLRNRARLSDKTYIYYAGLLGRHIRTADSLRQILEDFFDVPVQINQFAGTWRSLPKENMTFLSGSGRMSEQLGLGVVTGEEVWDHHGRIQISLGPMRFDRYQQFLPGETGYNELVGWMQFYSDGAYETQVQLILDKQDVPECELDGQGQSTPRLGLVSWLKTRPRMTDAGEATYLLA